VRELPGVFTDTIVSELGVSPQLWTLHYEAAMYLGLMLALHICGRYATLALAGVVILASGAMWVGERGQFSCLCFVSGAVLYHFRDRITWRPDSGFMAFAALVVLAPATAARSLAVIATLSYTAIGLGRSSSQPLRFITRHGDLSYGVYLWHYVVQQVVNSV